MVHLSRELHHPVDEESKYNGVGTDSHEGWASIFGKSSNNRGSESVGFAAAEQEEGKGTVKGTLDHILLGSLVITAHLSLGKIGENEEYKSVKELSLICWAVSFSVDE